jgi:hypothetical protein
MKEFYCCTETTNEAGSLLHATEDACPVVWMDSSASQLSTRLKLDWRS